MHLGAANWHKQQHSADEDGKYVLRCLIPQIVAFTNESQYGHEIALPLHVMFMSFSQSSSFAYGTNLILGSSSQIPGMLALSRLQTQVQRFRNDFPHFNQLKMSVGFKLCPFPHERSLLDPRKTNSLADCCKKKDGREAKEKTKKKEERKGKTFKLPIT